MEMNSANVEEVVKQVLESMLKSPVSPAPAAAPASPVTAGVSQADISQPENLQPETLYTIIEEKEKQKILDALLQTGGNISKAARQLGISRQKLSYHMKKHGIHR